MNLSEEELPKALQKHDNEEKDNNYPLSYQIRENQTQFWKHLLDLGLISKSKFERLIRSTSLSNSEKEGFIARQLVETRQSTKAIAGLLSKLYKKAKIIYPKAGLTADFKQKFDLIKVRELNDLHHAKDAYCNIVVGNVYYEKFTSKYQYVIANNERYSFSTSDTSYIFTNQNEKRLQQSGIWDSRNGCSISVVRKNYYRNNILKTIKQEEVKGKLFDLTLYGPSKATIKKKKHLGCEYGGYDKDYNTFFSFISFISKKKKIYRFIGIPLRIVENSNNIHDSIVQYLLGEKFENPQILIEKLPFPFILKNNETGFLYKVSSYEKANKRITLQQFNSLILSIRSQKILKAIESFERKVKLNDKKVNFVYDEKKSGFSEQDLTNLFSELKSKVENTFFNCLPVVITNVLKNIDLQTYRVKEKDSDERLLTIEQKVHVVVELLKAFQSNGASSDLHDIGESKNSGIVRTTELDFEKYSIINYSVTGFYFIETKLRDFIK